MSIYENIAHGRGDFPVGIHTTRSEKGFSLYPHVHREFEFLVITKGSGKMFIDEKEVCISEGCGVFVNSGELHLGQSSCDDVCEFFAVVFSPEVFGSLESDAIMQKYVIPIMENNVSLPMYYDKNTPWQCEVLDVLSSISSLNCDEGYEIKIKEGLFHILYTAYLHKIEKDNEKKNISEMLEAMEFIRKNYASHLSLSDIAQSVHMSEGHFSRKFSQVMHITVFEYLNKIRIDNACRLLQNTSVSVGEAASLCGFNGFSYFSKKFRKYVGCAPSAFRKK